MPDTRTVSRTDHGTGLWLSARLAPTNLALDHVPASGVTLNTVLQDVPEEEWKDHTYLKDKAIKDAAAGKGFAKRQLLDGTESRIGTIGRFYAKRRSTEPFMTRSDGKERLLTPIEHAAVKSIPSRLIGRFNHYSPRDFGAVSGFQATLRAHEAHHPTCSQRRHIHARSMI